MSSETDTEKWLTTQLKLPLVTVWFERRGELIDEKHVNDESTIFETVKMTIERLGLRSAVLPWQGRWCLYTPFGKLLEQQRFYDTREAAEMVMIHRG